MRGFLKAWLGHVERIERDRIAERVSVGECAGSRSVSRPRKRWDDTVRDCLKKRSFDVRQARKVVQERSEWGRFVRGNAWGTENKYLTLKKRHSCGLTQLYEPLQGWKSICGRGYNLKGIKGKFSVFLLIL